MIINFRNREISWGIYKLILTPTLIIIIIKKHFSKQNFKKLTLTITNKKNLKELSFFTVHPHSSFFKVDFLFRTLKFFVVYISLNEFFIYDH